MQKRILLRLMVVSICGVLLSTAVFFAIQTTIAHNSMDALSKARLNDAEERINMNARRIAELAEMVKEENLARAKALAVLIELKPSIIEDTVKLQEIADALSIDEIHIINENGILQWGTQPYRFGTNMQDREQTRAYLAILDDPSLEITQGVTPDVSTGVVRQYAGVSLLHTKGIVEVGVIPYRLLDIIKETTIDKVLSSIMISHTGYMFSVSLQAGVISSHPNHNLVGTRFTEILDDSGFFTIDGQRVRYHTKTVADELLVTAVPVREMYENRTISTAIFLLFIIIFFVTACIMINSYIKRHVVKGVHDLLDVLDKITNGDLEAVASVRSTLEFDRLSDGINHMLASLKGKITEVSEAMVLATEASRAKSLFLANMSHEIRTPMNGILGMTDLLMGEKLEERQLQYVRDIRTSAGSLLSIINDILDLSKIGEGRLQITPVHIDLSTLLKNIVSMMRFSARSKGLQFIDDIRIKSPEYVLVDDVRLNQVVLNIISNAVKFTNQGYVKFYAEIINGQIVMEISDTGIGIKKEDLPLIFAAFEQVDKKKNRTLKGTGLGLSISQSLVTLMGGKIWLESTYGKGTTFHVTIPYEEGDETAVETIDPAFQYVYAPSAHVLLVDDIQTNLTVGAGLLRLCGITADVAMSGMEAIELVKQNQYDIIFMDHMMPGMDGIEAMEHIRAMGDGYRNLPIIALTANAVNESKDYLMSSGMSDFISKPIDKGELMNVLQKWLPGEKMETNTTRQSNEYQKYSPILENASQIEGLDIQLALSRIGGIQSVLEISIKQVADSLKNELKKMDACLSAEDLRGFAIAAHGLKGALANIGATRHSELAAELEISAKAENKLLCINKFTVFSDLMSDFAEKLLVIFVKTETENRPTGDLDFMQEKAEEALLALDRFETEEALASLSELQSFTFGQVRDKLLDSAKTSIEAFNYEKSVALLTDLLRQHNT